MSYKQEQVKIQLLLYTVKQKKLIFFNVNVKITKRVHAFKGFTSSYNVEILNPLNLELQLKNTESAIKFKLKNY